MKKIVICVIIIILVLIVVVFSVNFYVVSSVKKQIKELNEIDNISDFDCILVLGAGVSQTGPSPLLEDRLKKAIEIYKINPSLKIIMSGDHGRKEYDEVNIMKEYAIKEGVPSEDIFMDHAGFSTYESIYRAKEIFKVEKMIIVTQEYHLYRSLYIANKLDVKAYGVSANKISRSGALYREVREVLARNKDFIKVIFKPKPTYLGEEIPITGNGNQTNDK